MSVQLAPLPVFRAVANDGTALVGGKLFTYIAGTTTPQATYVDNTQTTTNTNPIILNSRGEANVWLVQSQTYKLLLQDAAGNLIWSVDQITGNPLPFGITVTAAGNVTIGPPGGGTALTVSGTTALNGATAINGSTVISTTSGALPLQLSIVPSAGVCLSANGSIYSSTVTVPNFVMNCVGPNYGQIGNNFSNTFYLGYGTNQVTVGTAVLTWNNTGNVVINTPTSGTALAVNGPPILGVYAASIFGANVAGARGLLVCGGTGAADFSFVVTNAANTINLLAMTGNGAAQFSSNVGVNGAVPPAQVTGFGTPTGAAVIANYPGASATLVQTSNTVAEILLILKGFGLIGT
jgi:hypothetical protein